MKRTILLAGVMVLLTGCSQLQPLPIKAGDGCFRCSRIITDVKLATEVIDVGGHVYKFRTIRCMALDLTGNWGQLSGTFVTDYPTGKLVNAEDASFVLTILNDQTREKDYLAFRSAEDAAAFASDRAQLPPVPWSTVTAEIGGRPTSN